MRAPIGDGISCETLNENVYPCPNLSSNMLVKELPERGDHMKCPI